MKLTESQLRNIIRKELKEVYDVYAHAEQDLHDLHDYLDSFNGKKMTYQQIADTIAGEESSTEQKRKALRDFLAFAREEGSTIRKIDDKTVVIEVPEHREYDPDYNVF